MSASRRVASAGLLAIGGLHVLWVTGSSWPAREPGAISGRPAGDALGLAGRTDLLAPGSAATEEFRRLDRRVYSPLCLTLAALALPATVGSSR